jgi:hypothetical protein
MVNAERWDDVPVGCICRWTCKPAGWVITGVHASCPEPHPGDQPGEQLTLW